jgi:predicted amidohydrolase YtcJ
MIGIYSALRREDKRSGVVAGSSQCIGLMDAIRMYTINGAYVSCEEDIKGSIEIGKLADMVVLSENIMETPIDRIKEVKTDITMIDGVIKYRR